MNEPATARTGRRIAGAILTVLACVALVASVVAVWAGRTLLDTPTFSRTAADALTDPEVASALGDRLADEGVDLVWDAAELDRRVPAALEPYADSLADGLRTQLAAAATAVLEAPTTHDVLETNLERAHGTLLTVLEGDGDLPDDAVRLNLLPVLSRALLGLQDRGILPASLDLPTFEAGGDADDQIAELEEAVGRSLPDDFAQLTIYEGAAVGKASTLVQSGRDARARSSSRGGPRGRHGRAGRRRAGRVAPTTADRGRPRRRRRRGHAAGRARRAGDPVGAAVARGRTAPRRGREPGVDVPRRARRPRPRPRPSRGPGRGRRPPRRRRSAIAVPTSGRRLAPVATDHASALRVAIVVAGLLALSFVGLRATTFLVVALAAAVALLLVEALRQRST